MKKTDEYILGRIKWRFDKYEVSNDYTFFFDELSESIKAYLKSNLKEDLSGIPVLFFTKPSKQWTLLCTRQVVGYSGERIFRIDFKDIKKIEAFQTNRNKIKTEWDKLSIFDKEGNCHILHTGNGYAHTALHNILLMVEPWAD